MKKDFTPNLKTPADKLCKEELNKLNSNGVRGSLREDFQDESKPDLIWESEQLAKSHGIYLEFNRAKTGEEKDWMYMLRVSVPGGGPINRKQWMLVDELSEQYAKDTQGHSSIRLTTRQNIQFHWVNKRGVRDIVKTLAENGLNSLNGCGDNTRNVMGCPLSQFSDVFNANAWAQKAGAYFQLPVEPFIEVWAIDPNYIRKPGESFQYGPQLLNRKFKIAFSTVHRNPQTGKLQTDNCVEALTNDLAVVPVIENNKVARFQIYVGGGQGERNGKPTLAALGKPVCQIDETRLMKALDAVVRVHQEWGDRETRFWARVKYVIKKMGADWYREQMNGVLGFSLEGPDLNLDPGARDLHFGWHLQPANGLLAYGAFIENGRLIDTSPNGKLKTMVREIMKKYPVELMITPNQDILFTNIPPASQKDFEADLARHGHGQRNGKPYSQLRLLSGACVGRDTCRLTYTDSEKFEPYLIDELEKLGWGNLKESIGITGCERQCFRPATKSIGLVGSGLNRYQFKLMGSQDARYQGVPLISSDGNKMYLRSVPREKVATVVDTLFRHHQAKQKAGEDLGTFHRRLGANSIIQHLQENPATADLMKAVSSADCVLEP